MSWQDNRRRKRTWYKHYRRLCDQLVAMVNASEAVPPGTPRTPVAGEAIIKMFFDLYEERKMHKRRRVANSAFESLELAAKDSGLTSIALTPARYTDNFGRPPAIGEFGTEKTLRTAPPEYIGALPVRDDVDVFEAKKEIPF